MLKNKKKSFDYNIIILALCFMMILFGLGMWATKSLFVVPITEALGITRSTYSITDTLRYGTTAIVNIFFGYLISRFGSKKLICAGFCSLFISAILYANASKVFVLYLGGIFLGIGLSWTSTTIVGYIVNKACKRNRGTIMGFILAANGLGGAIASPIISHFIKEANNPFGYRNAFSLMAFIFACMFLLLLIFYKEPIQTKNETEETSKKKVRGCGWVGIEYTQAKKAPFFYGACICILFSGIVLQGVTGISSARMSDVGLNKDYVALIASISSLLLALSKFLNGIMYDRFGLRITITIDCIASIGVMACLYFITNSPLGMVLGVIYAILAAIALPLETVMLPIYANDLFGDKSFNKILGIFVSVNQIGYALGGPILNMFYDFLGSYEISLIVCGILMLVIVITMQFVINTAQLLKKQIEVKN